MVDLLREKTSYKHGAPDGGVRILDFSALRPISLTPCFSWVLMVRSADLKPFQRFQSSCHCNSYRFTNNLNSSAKVFLRRCSSWFANLRCARYPKHLHLWFDN